MYYRFKHLIILMHLESNQTPWLSTLLRYSLILKWFKSSQSPLSIYTQYPQITNEKWVFRKCITNKKYHIYIIIQTLYSVLCWNTFGSDYSLESSWVWQAWHICIWGVSPILLCRSCQVGWRASLHNDFMISPEMFNWVQVQALAGPFKDIQRLVTKPLLRCFGCLRPPVWGPEQVFIKDLSVLLHLRMEATVLEDLQCCRNVLVPFPRSVPWHDPVSELYIQFLRPYVLGFCSDMHCQLWDLI
jgi:hypothetical protein